MSASEEEFKKLLEEISRVRMPFGKFGPEHYPPNGVPIYDLPVEYLAWFALNGFPKGRLGYLLQMVYQCKGDGLDAVFADLRRKAGGRTRFRKKPQKNWNFSSGEND